MEERVPLCKWRWRRTAVDMGQALPWDRPALSLVHRHAALIARMISWDAREPVFWTLCLRLTVALCVSYQNCRLALRPLGWPSHAGCPLVLHDLVLPAN